MDNLYIVLRIEILNYLLFGDNLIDKFFLVKGILYLKVIFFY